jgi:hypothetical protein
MTGLQPRCAEPGCFISSPGAFDGGRYAVSNIARITEQPVKTVPAAEARVVVEELRQAAAGPIIHEALGALDHLADRSLSTDLAGTAASPITPPDLVPSSALVRPRRLN